MQKVCVCRCRLQKFFIWHSTPEAISCLAFSCNQIKIVSTVFSYVAIQGQIQGVRELQSSSIREYKNTLKHIASCIKLHFCTLQLVPSSKHIFTTTFFSQAHILLQPVLKSIKCILNLTFWQFKNQQPMLSEVQPIPLLQRSTTVLPLSYPRSPLSASLSVCQQQVLFLSNL